jgi:hypothetical protein
MDKEIEEFWEACGFKPITNIQQYPNISTNHPDDIAAWWYPDNDKNYHLPEITLDNLFKYAVPKVKVISFTNAFATWTVTINEGRLINGEVKVLVENDDLTQALYQAIKQVILK